MMRSVNMTPEELVQWGKAKGLLSSRIDLVRWAKKTGLIKLKRVTPEQSQASTAKAVEASRKEYNKLWARKKYAENQAKGLTANGKARKRQGFKSRILTPAQLAARRNKTRKS